MWEQVGAWGGGEGEECRTVSITTNAIVQVVESRTAPWEGIKKGACGRAVGLAGDWSLGRVDEGGGVRPPEAVSRALCLAGNFSLNCLGSEEGAQQPTKVPRPANGRACGVLSEQRFVRGGRVLCILDGLIG